jgi:hypothetical protein
VVPLSSLASVLPVDRTMGDPEEEHCRAGDQNVRRNEIGHARDSGSLLHRRAVLYPIADAELPIQVPANPRAGPEHDQKDQGRERVIHNESIIIQRL